VFYVLTGNFKITKNYWKNGWPNVPFNFERKSSSRRMFACVYKGTLIVMDWTTQSSDLNPIEKLLWDHLDRQLRLKSASNADQTFATLEKLWSEIPLNVLEVYINSIQNRCMAVIKAKSGHTKY
jgi:hypothetical protein